MTESVKASQPLLCYDVFVNIRLLSCNGCRAEDRPGHESADMNLIGRNGRKP